MWNLRKRKESDLISIPNFNNPEVCTLTIGRTMSEIKQIVNYRLRKDITLYNKDTLVSIAYDLRNTVLSKEAIAEKYSIPIAMVKIINRGELYTDLDLIFYPLRPSNMKKHKRRLIGKINYMDSRLDLYSYLLDTHLTSADVLLELQNKDNIVIVNGAIFFKRDINDIKISKLSNSVLANSYNVSLGTIEDIRRMNEC